MEGASPARRIGAAVIDVVLFYVVHVVVLLFVAERLPEGFGPKILLLGGAYAALLLLYGSPEIWAGATPGKRLLGLNIQLSTGNEPSRRQLALRWFLKSVPVWALFVVSYATALGSWTTLVIVAMCSTVGLVFLLGLVDFLFALGPKRQALRDRVTGTLVARVRGNRSSRGGAVQH